MQRVCERFEPLLGLLWSRRMPLTAWWSVMGGGIVSDSVILALPSEVEKGFAYCRAVSTNHVVIDKYFDLLEEVH